MKQVLEKLQQEVEIFQNENNSLCIENLSKAKNGIFLMEDIFHRLKSFIIEYHFRDKREEIVFFKEYKPKLFCNLIFYRKIYNLEMHRPTGGIIVQQEYFKKELEHIKDYFYKNMDFYHYYRSDNTFMDEIFFLRNQDPEVLLDLEVFYLEKDPRFSTNCDFKVTKILANDMLESYIIAELEKLENKNIELNNFALPKEKLTWTGSKTDLVELIYALVEAKVFNHGKATLKDIATYFENIFNIDLGSNPSRTFIDLCIRKARTAFLDKLQNLLIKKMDKENNKKDIYKK